MSALVLAAALASPAWALDPCKLTRAHVYGQRPGGSISVSTGPRRLIRDEEGPMLEMPLELDGVSMSEVAPGIQATWVLADETRITMVSANTAKPNIQPFVGSNSSGPSTSWTLAFPLTEEVIHAFAGSRALQLQYELLGTVEALELPRQQARSLQYDFACFANLTPREVALETE